MSDDNLKLKVKNELKTNMPNKLLLELFKEMNLNTSLGKNDAIDSIFQSYTAEEVKDMILKKYDEKGSYTRSKERFLKSINRKSIEERSKLKEKEEKERKRKKRQERIRKNKEKKEKSEKERKLKEKELEEKRRQIEKERVEEAKRRQEQNRKIEEEKKREEERRQEIQRKKEEEKKREEERRQEIQRKKEEEKRIKIEKDRKAKQKKREEKKRMKELLEKSSSNLKIYHAGHTDIYFIYDYIKSGIRKEYKINNARLSSEVKECVEIDDKLIKYKYHNYHIKFFTEKLLEAVKIISATYFADKDAVALVAVPPSEMERDPQTKKSIELIEEWSNKEKYGIDFKVYDKSKFLKRTEDVESSKEGNRSIEKHENSIECDENDNMPLNTGVIIFDDITTSGNTMYVCKNKIIEYGFNEDDVIPLAIARTVRPHTEIYESLGVEYIVYDEDIEELK